ncbi:50S ribosomal protein L30 [Buchnera aphidicola (Anoecia corni)]|uniref:Large ribosomal subunit protein uL30 n=1 Tax=Buchnera aphidicola (Anoecia corni) TaxID=2994477 RepID=A0AAT9IGQ3_9GAMM
MINNDSVTITQTKSSIGILPKHKATLKGLGLRYIGHTVVRKNTPSLQGMIKLVSYMLVVKEF